MNYSTDSFPTSLPTWLRDWARLNRDWNTNSQTDLALVQTEDLPTLWKLLNDDEVASKLHSMDCRKTANTEQFRIDITEILSVTCSSYRQAQAEIRLSARELEQELTRLAAGAEKLALQVDKFTSLLQDTVNLEYLNQRAQAERPAGFSQRKRTGLRRGSFNLIYPEAPPLTDILLAFCEDIREEIVRTKNRKADGGADAPIRFQTKRVKNLMQRLFGQANNALISALLSAANGQHIDEERIKKVKAPRGKI